MADAPASTLADSIPLAAGTMVVSEADTLQATPYRRSTQFGGTGGNAFADNLTEICRLAQLTVRHGSRVDAIQAVWELPSGALVTGQQHGGGGGSPSTFKLAKGEYINRIELRSAYEIDSLTFYTSAGNKHGPYGGSGGTPQEIAAGPINGFFGRSASRLDAFGVFSLTSCP
jgi:hypothetical protein